MRTLKRIVFLIGVFLLTLLILTACGDESPWTDLERQAVKAQATLEDVQRKSNDLRSFVVNVNPNYYSSTNERELAEISNELDNFIFDLSLQLDELKRSIEYQANH